MATSLSDFLGISEPRDPLSTMQRRNWIENLKSRFFIWIASGLDAERVRRIHLAEATIAPTATLAPEAAIDNFAGGRERVVIGEHSFIRGHLLTYGHGGAIRIGEWCYVGARCAIWSMNEITIGNRVLIGHDVNIHDGNGHPRIAALRHAHFKHIIEKGHYRSLEDMPGVKSAPIVIEDDVSISFGATILQGVRIGARSIIAPRAYVIQDVPSDVIYTTVPKPVMTPVKLFAR